MTRQKSQRMKEKLKFLESQIQQLNNDKSKLINQIVYLKTEELLPLLKDKKIRIF